MTKQLAQKEKTDVMLRTISLLDLVAKTNNFEWKMLPKEVIMGMVSMYIEGIKYAKTIEKDGENNTY